MDLKDEVEQFKRECRSIKYLKRKQRELEEKIEELDHALNGVKSPSLSEPRGTSSNSSKLILLAKKDELNHELSLILERLNNVYYVLEHIEDELEKQLVIDLWIEKQDYRKVARRYGYEDTAVYKKAKSIIKKAIRN